MLCRIPLYGEKKFKINVFVLFHDQTRVGLKKSPRGSHRLFFMLVIFGMLCIDIIYEQKHLQRSSVDDAIFTFE